MSPAICSMVTEPFPQANCEVGDVDFPPTVTMLRRALVGVMVVVPPFAVRPRAITQLLRLFSRVS